MAPPADCTTQATALRAQLWFLFCCCCYRYMVQAAAMPKPTPLLKANRSSVGN
jgi:hypothetical protein